jgi:hypothetical protein
MVLVQGVDVPLEGDELPLRLMRAPPRLTRSLVSYVAMIAPAVAGLIWNWPWLVTLALMLPGFLAHEALGYQAARERGIRLRSQLPSQRRITLLGVVGALVAIVAMDGLPQRAVPLAIGLSMLLVLEPVWRWEWRRRDALVEAQPEARPR